MEHHRLDPYPVPKDKMPLYINEPWLIDKTLLESTQHREPEEQPDNVRIYIPMLSMVRQQKRMKWKSA